MKIVLVGLSFCLFCFCCKPQKRRLNNSGGISVKGNLVRNSSKNASSEIYLGGTDTSKTPAAYADFIIVPLKKSK